MMRIILKTTYYILGFVATFISLFLMNSAQPALLYLVFIPLRILTNMMLPEDNDADDDHEGGDEGGFSDDVDDDVYLFPACPHIYEVRLPRFPSP